MQPAYFSPDPELVNPDSPEPFVDNFDPAPLEHPEPAIAEDEQRPPRQRGRPARVRSGSRGRPRGAGQHRVPRPAAVVHLFNTDDERIPIIPRGKK